MRTLASLGAVAVVRPVASVPLETDVWSPRLLDEHARERHDRLRREDSKAAFLAARAAAAQCVAALLDDGVAHEASTVLERGVRFVQTCRECRRAGHGQPRVPSVPGMHVSWSHSRGHVAAVAAWRPCGIDVEEVRLLPVPERAFTARELAWTKDRKQPARASLRLWTRKESLVKTGALTLSALGSSDLMDAEGRVPAGSFGGYALREQSVGDGLGSAVVALALAVDAREQAVSWL